MFMNNDRRSLSGFTGLSVPGSQKLAGLSLSFECHEILGGKILQIVLGGKSVVNVCPCMTV